MESIDELMLNEWDDMDVDIALVDLHSMDPDLLANLQYVGRQGEKIVDSILRYSSEFENCETVWTNQHVEAGHPYDFVVQLPQGKKNLYRSQGNDILSNSSALTFIFP